MHKTTALVQQKMLSPLIRNTYNGLREYYRYNDNLFLQQCLCINYF